MPKKLPDPITRSDFGAIGVAALTSYLTQQTTAHATDIVATLKRQQYKDGIGRHVGETEVASKSGALDSLRSDVGIAYTKDLVRADRLHGVVEADTATGGVAFNVIDRRRMHNSAS